MDENFERMLLRFLSGHGMNSPMAANRCVSKKKEERQKCFNKKIFLLFFFFRLGQQCANIYMNYYCGFK